MSVLTDSDIAVLNAARSILDEQSDVKHDADNGEVRAATLADTAEHAIFRFLNVQNAYLHRNLSYEQLHNAPAPEPQSLRA